MNNFKELAMKAGLSNFYFKDGQQAEGMFVVGKEFVEKFYELVREQSYSDGYDDAMDIAREQERWK